MNMEKIVAYVTSIKHIIHHISSSIQMPLGILFGTKSVIFGASAFLTIFFLESVYSRKKSQRKVPKFLFLMKITMNLFLSLSLMIIFSFLAAIFNSQGIEGGIIGSLMTNYVRVLLGNVSNLSPLFFIFPIAILLSLPYFSQSGEDTSYGIELDLQPNTIKSKDKNPKINYPLASASALESKRPKEKEISTQASKEKEMETTDQKSNTYTYEPPKVEGSNNAVFKDLLLSRKTMKKYSKPPLSLLDNVPVSERGFTDEHKAACDTINALFEEFGIQARVNKCIVGYAVILFVIEQKKRIKIDTLLKLEDDISFALGSNIKITENNDIGIPMCIELSNKKQPLLRLNHTMSKLDVNKMPFMSFPLGVDLSDNVHVVSLDSLPHLLIAGTTGSGKSVCLHTIIIGLLYSTSVTLFDFIMIDPKFLELNFYKTLPNLLMPIISNNSDAFLALEWLNQEMDQRYELMSSFNVRNIKEYNTHSSQLYKTNVMNNIVLIIEEFGDLILDKKYDFNSKLIKLAQKSRAAGIHIILATQRPSSAVVTGVLKANIPSRIAMQVSSKIESRIIIDKAGAETLKGKGDLLFSKSGASIIRLQSPYVTPDEISRIVQSWSS